MTPPNTTGAQALSDEQILSCMGDKQPARSSARHGAAIFEYRLFGLVDFARKVLALSSREQAGAVADAYLMTSASGATKWPLMPKDVTPEWRKFCAADGVSIQPLYLAAPGAAVAAREQGYPPLPECVSDWPTSGAGPLRHEIVQLMRDYVDADRLASREEASAASVERECNNGECGWRGVTDRMLGSIGPLCPDCGETTDATPEQSAKGLTMGGEVDGE